jgi:ribosomal protein L31E
MKGNEAEYVVPLRDVFNSPKGKRARRTIAEIKKFVWKHARSEDVRITTDVNQYLNKNSWHIPRKISVVLVKDKEKVSVYLKGSKQLEMDKKKASEKEKARKAKEDAKKAKEAAKEKKEESAEDEEQKKKLEEKREKEKAAAALERKRG